ncbi:MAG: hypothetical protein ACE5F9_15290 [Phycisphaerae bacterium]
MRPPPSSPPAPDTERAWHDYAMGYLAEQFPEGAPAGLTGARFFDDAPLEGEGAVVIYRFTANPGGQTCEDYHVVVGETEGNYYPAYGLDAEDAYHLHLGTRFMLVMGVAQADAESAADCDAAAEAQRIVDHVAPGEPIADAEVAVAFDVAAQFHAVMRCSIAGESVYLFGEGCPPGFSRRRDLAPQVVYRLHLGRILRREHDADT